MHRRFCVECVASCLEVNTCGADPDNSVALVFKYRQR